MRKLGSYLVILIFLTAYGRCVADQFGMLHMSNSSCCQTVCDNVLETCDQCPYTGKGQPQEPNHPDNQGDQETPAPCQLCFILDSDSMLLADGIKIPSPIFHELSGFLPSAASLNDTLRSLNLSFDPELKPSDHPDSPTEQRSRFLRTSAKTTPVRGPSIT